MYRFEEDFLFSLKELQKYIKTEMKKGSEQAVGEWTQFDSITEKKKHFRVQIYLGFGFMNIYRNITYILYLFLFLSQYFKGLPCTLLRARPCLRTSPTNYWQGLDDGSLTCTLIGWP